MGVSKFSIQHALKYKKGRTVSNWHNEIRDEIAYVATLASWLSRVREEPMINIIHNTVSNGMPVLSRTQSQNPSNPPSTNMVNFFDHSDSLINGLWEK